VDVPRAAEPLFALPPSRFTAERDALAKSLAGRGDRSAPAVRKLRRPVGVAWVLNRLARERPDEIEALVRAGERLRSGQRAALSGRGAEDLRAAEEELRARARTLRAHAERILASQGKAPSPATLARIELLLRVTAPLPGPDRDALSRGVLSREPDVASGDLAGFAVLQGGRAGAAARATRPPSRAGAAARERDGAREASARAQRERKEERERLRSVAEARRAADSARTRAERDRRAASTAAERAELARRRAAESRERAERLAARVRELERRR
jgi:hypothetical protein